MTDRLCLDFFSGLGGFSSEFREADGWDVIEVDIDESFEPDICADILDLRPSDLLETVAEYDVVVILASIPCESFSRAAHGTHIDADARPVSEKGADDIALALHTIGLILGLDPDFWVVENPVGRLKDFLGPEDAHIWWCQYGSERAKPTHLWGNLPASFDERSCRNGNPACDHERAPDGTKGGTASDDLTPAERGEIPRGLSREILEAVERDLDRPTVEQSDLAGYG